MRTAIFMSAIIISQALGLELSTVKLFYVSVFFVSCIIMDATEFVYPLKSKEKE